MLRKYVPDTTQARVLYRAAGSSRPALTEQQASALVRWIMDQWVRPEVDRRRATDALLSPSFILNAAQVILKPGVDVPEVRLNDEVRATLIKVQGRDNIDESEIREATDSERVVGLDLFDSDPNAAHITFFKMWQGWLLQFDFRYNGTLVTKMVEVAEEFLVSAADSLSKENLRAFIENLYDAVELLAKGELLLMANGTVSVSKRHGIIRSEYNLSGKEGLVDRRYAHLLNRLSSKRNAARYLEGDLDLSVEEADIMLAVAEEMHTTLKDNLPERARAA